MKRTNKKRGFTIIELTIVVAVIAILSAVLIPTFASIIKKAKQSSDEQAVRSMNTVVQTITEEDPDIFDVAAALSESGFATETGLYPTLKNHAFYWHKPTNTIVYVNVEDGEFELVFPKNVKDFSEEGCQALGTVIDPEATEAPIVVSSNVTVPTNKGGATIPSDVDTIEELANWTTNVKPANVTNITTVLSNGKESSGVEIKGNVKLTADLVLGGNNSGSTMLYNIATNVTIDLNGYSIIQKSDTRGGKAYALFAIRGGATLNIIDSSTTQTGAIKVAGSAFQIDKGAVVNMYSGTITVAEDRNAKDTKEGCVLVANYGGTFNMYGGKLDVSGAVAQGGDYCDAIGGFDAEAYAGGVNNLFAGEINGTIYTYGAYVPVFFTTNVYDAVIPENAFV